MFQGSAVPYRRPEDGEERQRKKKGCCTWLCKCCCPSRHAPVEPGDSDDEEAAADAKAFVHTIKNATGLWESDPDEVGGAGMRRVSRPLSILVLLFSPSSRLYTVGVEGRRNPPKAQQHAFRRLLF